MRTLAPFLLGLLALARPAAAVVIVPDLRYLATVQVNGAWTFAPTTAGVVPITITGVGGQDSLDINGTAPASAASGTNAGVELNVAGATGGIATGAGSTAGRGANITLATGTGGAASAAPSNGVGGAGGAFALSTGPGGVSSAVGGTGGAGGAFTITTGSGTGAGTATGGAGGNISLTAGNGANGTSTGGNGGAILLKPGSAGTGGSPTNGTIIVRAPSASYGTLLDVQTNLSASNWSITDAGAITTTSGSDTSSNATTSFVYDGTGNKADVFWIRDGNPTPTDNYFQIQPTAITTPLMSVRADGFTNIYALTAANTNVFTAVRASNARGIALVGDGNQGIGEVQAVPSGNLAIHATGSGDVRLVPGSSQNVAFTNSSGNYNFVVTGQTSNPPTSLSLASYVATTGIGVKWQLTAVPTIAMQFVHGNAAVAAQIGFDSVDATPATTPQMVKLDCFGVVDGFMVDAVATPTRWAFGVRSAGTPVLYVDNSGDTTLSSNTSTAAYLELLGASSAPANPASNNARMFAQVGTDGLTLLSGRASGATVAFGLNAINGPNTFLNLRNKGKILGSVDNGGRWTFNISGVAVDGTPTPQPVAGLYVLNASTTGTTPVASSSTTPQPLTGTGWNPTLQANTFIAGRTLKVRAGGIYSTTGTPNLTLSVYYGTTIVWTSGAITTPNNASSQPWNIDVDVNCMTTGGSGTLVGVGTYCMGGLTTACAPAVTSGGTVTVDTTAASAWQVQVIWSAASASNTITGYLDKSEWGN